MGDQLIEAATHSVCGTQLRPPVSPGMKWRFCTTCETYIHAPCGNQVCKCDNGKSSATRAQKTKVSPKPLASTPEPEVDFTAHENTPQSEVIRPEKGQSKMATKSKSKSDKTVDKRTDPEARRGRGELEALVLEVADDFDEGKIDLDGKTLTPARIAKIIGEKKDEDTPSAGAVSAILKRWDEMGYALTHEKPYAYKGVSARGKKQGLADIKEKFREKKKAERAAAKEAKAS